ncbi:DUF6950 family protein [Marinicauda sp. Alg238-R41]|uniref:DUF6950 family protein n=1 Tax=Marinicauda sp. Alg238-R41 TaxID=2993447 RepID=UPI0022E09ED1|nr:hypothetical protein [Marinicauda sp. Alg238-R41]
MAKSENALLVRQRVVRACLDRFDKKPRQYGSVDCVKSTAFVLRKAKVKIPMLKGKTYGSRGKAKALLDETGYACLVECIDALGLERIAPLATLPGDIIALPVPDSDPFGASLFIVHTAGAHRAFGFDPMTSCFEVGLPDLSACLAAWRVPHG